MYEPLTASTGMDTDEESESSEDSLPDLIHYGLKTYVHLAIYAKCIIMICCKEITQMVNKIIFRNY